jgi:hypothetical protein
VAGLELDPLSLMSTSEELLERSSGFGLEIRDYGHWGSTTLTTQHPSICKSWHWLRRQAAVIRLVYFTHGLEPRSYYLVIVLYPSARLNHNPEDHNNKWLLWLGCFCWY